MIANRAVVVKPNHPVVVNRVVVATVRSAIVFAKLASAPSNRISAGNV